MIRPISIFGVALLAALLAPTLAFAQSATATTSVNVRNAPRTGAVVAVLQPGERVDIDRCDSGWCFVNRSGPDGWVSANYLNMGGGGGSTIVSPARPNINLGFSVPGFSFQIGNGGFDLRPDRPFRPGNRDRVCFYERSNFRGNSLCLRPGDDRARLGNWDQRIASIAVDGDARALVCERTNFNGRCVTINRDTGNLGGADGRIRSVRVR